MNISTTDAKGLFTKDVVELYKERTTPMTFLRSFFKVKESPTKLLSIEVQRGTEKVAVDVARGTDGNRNTFSKSSEKIFEPPYYREFTDITELSLYDRLFGQEEISSRMYATFLEQVADSIQSLQEKIERAYELQCAQAFDTGIVQLNAGINIDFKRKAGSLVDKGNGNYWINPVINPYTDLEAGCNFLRQVGKAHGGIVNAIFGSTALSHFLGNDIVKARADIRNFALDNVSMPQRNSVGASLHGEVTAGAYTVRIWSYPEFYDNANGVSTPYIDPKKVILLPENPKFTLGFAAVPQLLTENSGQVKTGAYVIEEYIDTRKKAHIIDVTSAGVAILTAVDQLYTLKAVQ